MGYFANGIEGEMWQADNCCKCGHASGGCPVLELSMRWNYEQDAKGDAVQRMKAEVLSSFIPRSQDGPWNDDCKMFVAREGGKGDE